MPGSTSGAKGVSVKCLQDKLTDDGYILEKATGMFDKAPPMRSARFQFATPPLHTDGMAGPSTLAAMGIWSGKTINRVEDRTGRGRSATPVGHGRLAASRSPTGT